MITLLPNFHMYSMIFSQRLQDLVHNYNTRLASKQSYYIPPARTNYGKLSLLFNGAKIWNSKDESYKQFTKNKLKKQLKSNMINCY